MTARRASLPLLMAVVMARADEPPLLPPTGGSVSRPTTQAASQPAMDDADRPLANREDAARDRALQRFGGDRQTERAVADGLSWLAAHQRRDGVWDRERFDEQCPADDRCAGTAINRYGQELNVGISALASLAFLGAGHTHQRGPYAKNLDRAFSYILAQQTPDGTFAPTSPMQMYNDALATLAIAEAFAMTKDPVLDRPLRRAVGHLARSQQERGGWDYSARLTGRNDTSITGWVMMALKSAAAAGVTPPRETLWRMIEHFNDALQPDGQVWYANVGNGVQMDQATGQRMQRFGPAMTAVGLYAHATIGFRADEEVAKQMARRLLADPPSFERMTRKDPTNLHSEYYFYYGTLALFHRGGEEWFEWNKHLKNCILEYQERPTRRDGGHKHAYGSWPPFGLKWGLWGKMGGRVYSTAINVLSLEIYYRYVPSYLSTHGLIGPRELQEYVDSVARDERHELIPRILRFHADTVEPVLLSLMRSGNEKARLAAAMSLAGSGSPLARGELLRQRDLADATTRERIVAVLGRLDAMPRPAAFGRVTRVSPAAGMILFDTRGEAIYYDQVVRIMRDGREVARARIDRRFAPHRAAAAVLLAKDAGVREGDQVAADATHEESHAGNTR